MATSSGWSTRTAPVRGLELGGHEEIFSGVTEHVRNLGVRADEHGDDFVELGTDQVIFAAGHEHRSEFAATIGPAISVLSPGRRA
ncbi:MAG: hypothetical protein ACK5KU_04905 [Beutenbergiaceae bacterium]